MASHYLNVLCYSKGEHDLKVLCYSMDDHYKQFCVILWVTIVPIMGDIIHKCYGINAKYSIKSISNVATTRVC